MRVSASLVLATLALSVASSLATARDSDFYDPFGGTGRLRVGFANQLSLTLSTVGPRVRIQGDGSLLVAGTENSGPGINQAFHVLRVLPNGSPDAAFGNNGESGEAVFDFDLVASGSDQVEDIAPQPDGSILLVGAAEGPSATTGLDCAVARLDSSGQLDTSLNSDGRLTVGFDAGPSGWQNDQCLSVLVQHDGQIVVAGSAEVNSSGTNTMAVARFNSDGTPDNSFSSNGVSNKHALDLSPLVGASAAVKVVELSTHKLLLVGVGAIASGGSSEEVWTLVRMNSNGTMDTSYGFNGVAIYAFQSGGADVDVLYDAIVLADDSIVAAGYTSVQGNPQDQIAVAKFAANGALDASWGNGGRQIVGFGLGGAHGDVGRGIAMDSQGRFVIAGAADVGGNPDNYDMVAVRLLSDGTFDPSFGVQGKRDVQLSAAPTPDYFEAALGVAVGADDSIILGGVADPDGAGNTQVFGIARLIGDTLFDSGFGG